MDGPSQSHLWTLFRPHELIYVRDPVRGWQNIVLEYCAVVSRIKTTVDTNTGRKRHDIYYIVGSHDGRRFDPREMVFSLHPLTNDLVDINTASLQQIPMRFVPADEQQRIRVRLIERGKKYVGICGASFTLMHYNGPIGVGDNTTAKFLGDFSTRGPDGINYNWRTSQRVVVDSEAQAELCQYQLVGENLSSPSIHEFFSRRAMAEEDDYKEDAEGSDDDMDDDAVSVDTSTTEIRALLKEPRGGGDH